MRRLVVLSAVLGLASFAPSQKVNEFHIFDGTTEFTSRGSIGGTEGEILNKVPKANVGGLKLALGMGYHIQDQNQATREIYYLIIRKADKNGKPDVSKSGLIYKEGPYSVGGSGSGVRAWYMRTMFKRPVVLPDDTFFYGIKCPPTTGWANGKDGFSIHVSVSWPKNCGEHPRLGFNPHMAWQVPYANGKPSAPNETTDIRSYWMSLLVGGPVLQPFTVDPSAPPSQKCKKGIKDLGFAAFWPDLVDLEKYGYKAQFGWRVRAATFPNGLGLAFVSSKLLPKPITTPYGSFYLLPSDRWFLIVGGLSVRVGFWGEGDTVTLNPPDPVRYAMLGMHLYAQGVMIGSQGKTIQLTNWTGTSF